MDIQVKCVQPAIVATTSGQAPSKAYPVFISVNRKASPGSPCAELPLIDKIYMLGFGYIENTTYCFTLFLIAYIWCFAMNEAHIEKAATDLLMQIYRDRRYLWPDQEMPPMMMRSPRIAAGQCLLDHDQAQAILVVLSALNEIL
ncbi:hypothetical protein NJH83_14515 [Pseudomonas chlororaphis]|uniref:hypothetical protein n=1 Tax=Pseudomonas chlororaphis TaxID=587753 RepID=UPI00209A7593|nr:hypothetical protein [Pseudomonas chlororaphis]MCO7611448.1 hypothetical protein [Pseudomonas chlororaphis]